MTVALSCTTALPRATKAFLTSDHNDGSSHIAFRFGYGIQFIIHQLEQVRITLEEPQEGTTVLHLTHSGIPEEDGFGNEDVLETTTNGWKQQIFHKIRAVFGFGLGL